mmetsp:Transcript_121590/g.389069  ORF Transcript_121590/g.389069 Transcript_121590/m.389069 type:complete len:243 (+) Transcript_121590:1453-2181(+)
MVCERKDEVAQRPAGRNIGRRIHETYCDLVTWGLGDVQERSETSHIPALARTDEQERPCVAKGSVFLQLLRQLAQHAPREAGVDGGTRGTEGGPSIGPGWAQDGEAHGVGEVVLLEVRERNDDHGPKLDWVLQSIATEDRLAQRDCSLCDSCGACTAAKEVSELLLRVEVFQMAPDRHTARREAWLLAKGFTEEEALRLRSCRGRRLVVTGCDEFPTVEPQLVQLLRRQPLPEGHVRRRQQR